VWEIVVPFLDLVSFQSLLLLNPYFFQQERCSHHFHATLSRQLENLRNTLEIKTQAQTEAQTQTQALPCSGRSSVLLFLVGVYLYHPHIVRKLTLDPYLDRFVRFFRDVPSLLRAEEQGEEEELPSCILQHLLKEYKLGIVS
jgi:hypothetical protein